MTKRINTAMIVGLMAGLVLLAGCKREYGTVTLGANIDNGRDAKVYIDNLTPCWHNNDLIRVNNQTCTTSAALGSSAQITNVVESNHYRAIYPADIVGDVDISSSSTIAVTLPHEQQYEVDSRGDQKVKVPMGAYSSNESLTFHNLCSVIKVVVSNRTDDDFILGRIKVTANRAYLSGQGRTTVSGNQNDAIILLSSYSSRHDVSLEFTSTNRPTIGRGDRDTYVYYIVAPEFAEDDVIITLYSTNGQSAVFEKRGVSLHHNRMATVSLIVEQFEGESPIDPPSENGVLPGLFSVSENLQVHFSQGNLQYQASTNTWRFADHQYDYVGGGGEGTVLGSDNCNISCIYSEWIDLFGWGTSGWNSGAVCYQPWSTSTRYSDYCPGGSYTNDLTGAYAEADWAWHNAISNGGNAVHHWRTLTIAEWDYLLRHHTNAPGTINGVDGLIILPDSWTLPTGCTFDHGVIPDNEYAEYPVYHNNYTFSQWAAMEAAGAVFLPAAGDRYGSRAAGGLLGFYWSSTSSGDDFGVISNPDNEYYNFMTGYEHRQYGFSVRPVLDIN